MGHRSVNLLRLAAVLALALTFVFLQAAIGWPRRLLGAQVDLLPALMTYTALRLGSGSVITLAFVGGLCLDALSLNPLGVSPLPLAAVGLVLLGRREELLRDELFAQSVLGGVASLLAPLGTLIVILTAGASPLLGPGFLWHLAVMGVAGAIVTPLIFRFLDGLQGALSHPQTNQPSFRPDREIRRGRN